MCALQSRTGQIDKKGSRSENRTSQQYSKKNKLILLANKHVRLSTIFRKYSIKIERFAPTDVWSMNITCPFPTHKGGRERTPSFGYNFIDDRFYCFGCKRFGRAVEFIAYKDRIHPEIVAEKLIEQYSLDQFKIDDKELVNDWERIQTSLTSISIITNKLYQKYSDNEEALRYIDNLIWFIDRFMYSRVSIPVDELEERCMRVVELLKEYD